MNRMYSSVFFLLLYIPADSVLTESAKVIQFPEPSIQVHAVAYYELVRHQEAAVVCIVVGHVHVFVCPFMESQRHSETLGLLLLDFV